MKDGFAKYSCSASPLMLAKCRTAIYGFGGGGISTTNTSLRMTGAVRLQSEPVSQFEILAAA
ncbi:hypothetical protein [Mesorhizobium sp.]|uniref:hypothetical protein n=1 Tax=Mesorhizobium sp. TaxID=1871066 RepID=UPI0025C4BBDE|nr:hypothetical protein [Mesorhizobium sp.]